MVFISEVTVHSHFSITQPCNPLMILLISNLLHQLLVTYTAPSSPWFWSFYNVLYLSQGEAQDRWTMHIMCS